MKYQAATQNNVDLLTWKRISMFKKEERITEQYLENNSIFVVFVWGGGGEASHIHSQEKTWEGGTLKY